MEKYKLQRSPLDSIGKSEKLHGESYVTRGHQSHTQSNSGILLSSQFPSVIAVVSNADKIKWNRAEWGLNRWTVVLAVTQEDRGHRTLRDSFRASLSVGEGHSFSTPLNIRDSDWGGGDEEEHVREEEKDGVQRATCLACKDGRAERHAVRTDGRKKEKERKQFRNNTSGIPGNVHFTGVKRWK